MYNSLLTCTGFMYSDSRLCSQEQSLSCLSQKSHVMAVDDEKPENYGYLIYCDHILYNIMSRLPNNDGENPMC